LGRTTLKTCNASPHIQKLLLRRIYLNRILKNGAAQWIEYVVPRQEAGQEYAFAILNENRTLVGVSELVDVKDGAAELGFWIGKSYWGREYATKAGQKTLRFASEELGLKRVFGRPLERNTPSRRIVEKLDFEFKQIETHENPKWEDADKVARYKIHRDQWKDFV